jgi:hypothetical protein
VEPFIAGIPERDMLASFVFKEDIGSAVFLASKDLLIETLSTKSVKSISSLGETSTSCILFKSEVTSVDEYEENSELIALLVCVTVIFVIVVASDKEPVELN